MRAPTRFHARHGAGSFVRMKMLTEQLGLTDFSRLCSSEFLDLLTNFPPATLSLFARRIQWSSGLFRYINLF